MKLVGLPSKYGEKTDKIFEVSGCKGSDVYPRRNFKGIRSFDAQLGQFM